MTFLVNLRRLSFKQNLSDKERLLEDQASTYAILRYAQDIPTKILEETMSWLIRMYDLDMLWHRKLMMLVNEYRKVSKISMIMDEEFVETIEVPVTFESNMHEDMYDEDDTIILTL